MNTIAHKHEEPIESNSYISNQVNIDTVGNCVRSSCFKKQPKKGTNTRKGKPATPKGSVSEYRAERNIKRTKGTMVDYGYYYPWTHIVHFTANSSKQDTNSFLWMLKDLRPFFKTYFDKDKTFAYLVGMEWSYKSRTHAHGLLNNPPMHELVPMTYKEAPYEIKRKMCKHGRKYYRWPAYEKMFGFALIEEIYSIKQAITYITKYYSYQFRHLIAPSGMDAFFRSPQLKPKRCWFKLRLINDALDINNSLLKINKFDWESDYCAISNFDESCKGAIALRALALILSGLAELVEGDLAEIRAVAAEYESLLKRLRRAHINKKSQKLKNLFYTKFNILCGHQSDSEPCDVLHIASFLISYIVAPP